MKFGICCGPQSFGGSDVREGVARLADAMQNAGADYFEFAASNLKAGGDEKEYQELHEALASQTLKPEVFNIFLPAPYRITGPEVNLAPILAYATTTLQRCKEVGGEVMVLGSGAARRVAEGFDGAEARSQFLQFCRELGPIAKDAGIDIAIEPLNHREDNLINSVEQGAQIVDEANHPRICLLADLYHIAEDNETLENTARAGARLAHAHVADIGRVAPGFAENDEQDFVGFFHALRRAGYDGRCSFEGKFDDIATQSKPALDLMKQRWRESA
ncbi:MAG TPA: sugar phosphate isomerase/epimerase family protein [Abditibacteriaceae bacterium]|jgi:sugar phosphate isomerase/epimerase